MKKYSDTLDATPPKEIYRSIIADYGLTLGVCELIDNAIDVWTRDRYSKTLNIDVDLDVTQQKITITDNSGGIAKDDIILFVSPGRTGNTAKEETIGIFGVGSKRAVVALSENVKVRTRKGARSFQIEFNEDWLQDESWDLPIYEVDQINNGTTIIELFGLRFQLDVASIERVRKHLNETYSLFLKKGDLKIKLNKTSITGREFDNEWSYPPNFAPQKYLYDLPVEGSMVKVEILGGVINERASGGGESGVYFYCNERLIAKALKDFEVGYITGKAGAPNHPGASLGRVIIKLKGEAQFMPWNSSKSAINYQHKVFTAIQESIIDVISYFVGLSRRTQGDWPNNIYKYDKGTIINNRIQRLDEISNLYNVPLPRTRKRYDEKLIDKNKALGKRKPWAIGLYESIAAVDFISKKNLKQKNRIALIILDSNLEIALKEYLVHEIGIGNQRFNNIKENRTSVINEVKAHNTAITNNEWQRANFYYLMRNNLIHQKTTAAVSDSDIDEYRMLVEKILKELFGLKF